MNIFDILIIVLILFGMYLGYQRGVIKELSDLGILLFSMIVASPISKLLCMIFYPILPFFNFTGSIKGLKSLNIILYRLVFYFLILIILIYIIRTILLKLGLLQKITNTMVEVTIISKLLGLVTAFPLMIIFLYNIMFILNSPFVNLDFTNDSKGYKIILEKTLIISKQNERVYLCENDTKKIVNGKYNTDKNYRVANDKILKSSIKHKLISNNNVKKLKDKKKILGNRKLINNDEQNTTLTEESDSNSNIKNKTNTTNKVDNNNGQQKEDNNDSNSSEDNNDYNSSMEVDEKVNYSDGYIDKEPNDVAEESNIETSEESVEEDDFNENEEKEFDF